MSTIRVRGFAPSVGAGGSLIVAGLCCLAFVSAMLAFRDWPHGLGGRPDGSLELRVLEVKAAGRVAARPVPASAARASSGGSRAVPPRREGAALRPSAPTAPRAPSAPPAAPQTVIPPALAPAPVPAPAQRQPEAPAAPSGAGAAAPQPSPGPAEQLVATGRRIVEQAPPLPAPVQRPADQVLETTQAAARTVDQATAPLLP